MAISDFADTVQDQVIEGMKTAQDAVVDGVRFWAETVESIVPDLSSLPFTSQLPDPSELAKQNFELAERFYALQKEFATRLVEASAPVYTKVRGAASA